MLNWALASDLDRVDHHRRSPDWVASLWRSADAKLLKLDQQARFTTRKGGSRLRMTTPFVEYDSQRHRLLGMLRGSPIFAVEAVTEGEIHDFREIAFKLDDNEREIAATASAVLHWHQAERFCGRCGAETRVINGGFARHCDACAIDHFPRTDPAVIVGVLDPADRLLLGGQPNWGNRVSVLAGFVEAGESLEQAIHREIGEEADITIGATKYFGSQPWPFPRSLMVGYFARATSTAISVDTEELAHAAWMSREEVLAGVESGEIGLPGASSIASRLIQAWLGNQPGLI